MPTGNKEDVHSHFPANINLLVQRKQLGFWEGLGNSHLNVQRTGLGTEVGTGESKRSPKHLCQVLHEGMVRNPDAYKL